MNRHYTAAIFDLDGTLTDNMGLHREAYAVLMQRYGLRQRSQAEMARLDGKRNDQILPVIFERPLSPEEIAHLADEKESCYRELAAEKLKPLAGLFRLLDQLEAQGIALAVATSAPHANVSFSMEALGLVRRIPLIVRGDEVPNGKPAPDVFLETARRLGKAPHECIVFEDAFAGIEAAHAAGMYCVAVTTTNNREQLLAHGLADVVVQDFEEYLGLAAEDR